MVFAIFLAGVNTVPHRSVAPLRARSNITWWRSSLSLVKYSSLHFNSVWNWAFSSVSFHMAASHGVMCTVVDGSIDFLLMTVTDGSEPVRLCSCHTMASSNNSRISSWRYFFLLQGFAVIAAQQHIYKDRRETDSFSHLSTLLQLGCPTQLPSLWCIYAIMFCCCSSAYWGIDSPTLSFFANDVCPKVP